MRFPKPASAPTTGAFLRAPEAVAEAPFSASLHYDGTAPPPVMNLASAASPEWAPSRSPARPRATPSTGRRASWGRRRMAPTGERKSDSNPDSRLVLGLKRSKDDGGCAGQTGPWYY